MVTNSKIQVAFPDLHLVPSVSSPSITFAESGSVCSILSHEVVNNCPKTHCKPCLLQAGQAQLAHSPQSGFVHWERSRVNSLLSQVIFTSPFPFPSKSPNPLVGYMWFSIGRTLQNLLGCRLGLPGLIPVLLKVLLKSLWQSESHSEHAFQNSSSITAFFSKFVLVFIRECKSTIKMK